MIEFNAKIKKYDKGKRFSLTIPKRMIDNLEIIPDIIYKIKLEKLPIEETSINEKAEVKN